MSLLRGYTSIHRYEWNGHRLIVQAYMSLEGMAGARATDISQSANVYLEKSLITIIYEEV